MKVCFIGLSNNEEHCLAIISIEQIRVSACDSSAAVVKGRGYGGLVTRTTRLYDKGSEPLVFHPLNST